MAASDDLTRIEAKVDKIEEHLGKQEVSLARLTVSVEEHVRRTNLLEDKLAPVETHVAMVNGALKLLGIIAMITGIIELGMKILK